MVGGEELKPKPALVSFSTMSMNGITWQTDV
jgi:hypothetical protein